MSTQMSSQISSQLPAKMPAKLPQTSPTPSKTRWPAARWRLLFLALVCAAPVIASYFTYYVIRPEGRRNFGELVAQQAIPADLVLRNAANGIPVPPSSLRKQWLLVSVSGGACGAKCEQHLYWQRQIREMLGREKPRVDLVWLIQDTAPIPANLAHWAEQATVLRVQPGQLAQWLQPAAGQSLEAHLYLVDPQSNFMMRFPASIQSAEEVVKIKKDLERLLRASNSWDKAGRS